MLLRKETSILYIHKNGITFYINNQIPGLQFDFTNEIIDDNLEVISADKLKAQLATFLKENNLKPHSGVLLLSEEIVLQKDVVSESPQDERIEIQKFFDEVPFSDMAKLVYKMDGKVQVIATNRLLYTSIVDLLRQFEWNVKEVVPLRLFGEFASNDILNAEDIAAIQKQPKVLKQGNLLTETETEFGVESSEGRAQEKPSFFGSKKFFIPFLLVLFLLGVGAGSLFLPWRAYLPKNLSFLPSPTPTVIPPTPTIAEVQKDKLKIKVINGTGKVGQAGVVKTALTGLGYKTVDTATGDSTDATSTDIIFDASVSQTDRDVIVKDLEKQFANVSGKTGTPATGYQIQITTGTEK